MNFFSAFLEMFRNSDQFIAHMSAEYGIYVYLQAQRAILIKKSNRTLINF